MATKRREKIEMGNLVRVRAPQVPSINMRLGVVRGLGFNPTEGYIYYVAVWGNGKSMIVDGTSEEWRLKSKNLDVLRPPKPEEE